MRRKPVMSEIQMRRQAIPDFDKPEHAGLLIDHGFKEDRGDKLHNDDKMRLFADAKDIIIPEVYKTAYEQWQKQQIENLENSRIWFGKLINRMFIGMGEANPLEAGITLHHTYGVPFIPGSAIKGVLHHYAYEVGLPTDIKNILFGIDAKSDDTNKRGEAGYIIFNDAWWVPKGKALAPETITVHAQKYYGNKGKDFIHPDFESPNPNPQIAIQGSFMFSIEGDESWVEYANKLLESAMKNIGVGGKTASGYGYFEEHEDIPARRVFEQLKETYAEELKKKKVAREKAIADDLYKNAPKHEQNILKLEDKLDSVNKLSGIQIKQNYSDCVGQVNKLIDDLIKSSKQYNEKQEDQIKSLLNNIYEKIGWYMPSANKKQKTKQRLKKETIIKNLFIN